MGKIISNEMLIEELKTTINDLNMQIENGLKTQMQLRLENYELQRNQKSIIYAINGFMEDGMKSIHTHVEKRLQEFFGARSIMDAKFVARNNNTGRLYLVLDQNVYNHNDITNQYVLFCDTDITPQVMKLEDFKEKFEIFNDISKFTREQVSPSGKI